MNEENIVEESDEVSEQNQAISDGYKKAYEELTQTRGFSPRKARRYLDSIAKRNVRKFMKGKKNTVA